MPFKNLEKRKEYNRLYMRKRKANFSAEKMTYFRKQQREHKRDILSSKSPEQKEKFYKRAYILAKKRGRYKNISSEMVRAYHKLRDKVVSFLGSRCSNPNCRWKNDDGSFGCILKDCLQVDHVYGGGRKEKEKGATFLRKVLRDTTGAYQLLCANCNWIKRVKNGEVKISPYRQAIA